MTREQKCKNKTAYRKRKEALRNLHSMNQRFNAGKRLRTHKDHQGERLGVYKCPVCKLWHIGHQLIKA